MPVRLTGSKRKGLVMAGGGLKGGVTKGSPDKIVAKKTGQPEIAVHPLTKANLTDIIDADEGNLPAARYPRSSHENAVNRFYVPEPEAAGDMRAKIVRGEVFTHAKGAGNEYDHGKMWDKGEDGDGARGFNTEDGE